MGWLVVLSILVIALYTLACCFKFHSVPNSISATFYRLNHPYIFTLAMWATAGLLMPVVLEVSKEWSEWMAFLSCAGMMFVGAAPAFKQELEGKVHTAGAIICVAGSQLWVACNCAWCLFAWVAWLVYTVWKMSKSESYYFVGAFLSTKPMFWLEVTALVSTYIAVILKLLGA